MAAGEQLPETSSEETEEQLRTKKEARDNEFADSVEDIINQEAATQKENEEDLRFALGLFMGEDEAERLYKPRSHNFGGLKAAQASAGTAETSAEASAKMKSSFEIVAVRGVNGIEIKIKNVGSAELTGNSLQFKIHKKSLSGGIGPSTSGNIPYTNTIPPGETVKLDYYKPPADATYLDNFVMCTFDGERVDSETHLIPGKITSNAPFERNEIWGPVYSVAKLLFLFPRLFKVWHWEGEEKKPEAADKIENAKDPVNKQQKGSSSRDVIPEKKEERKLEAEEKPLPEQKASETPYQKGPGRPGLRGRLDKHGIHI